MEDLKGLIDKINEEGVKAAEEKAAEILSHARKDAEAVIAKARSEAAKLGADAKDKNAKTEEATRALLKQAARDTLINLKKEIDAALQKVIIARVREALSADEISKAINSLIKDLTKEEHAKVVVSLESAILNQLKDEIKKGITFKASDDISAGFIISYDNNKSHFDFTDKALAEYIGSHLKPKLAEILNG